MVILLNPVLYCNLRCEYCYAWRHFDKNIKYDKERMFESLKELIQKWGKNISVALHGGEPTLLPIDELEDFFKRLVDLGIRPSIQTNGSLITDRHIELFKKYNVSVGISIDGFPEENKLRASPNITKRILLNIVKLRKNGIPVSILSVFHKYNAGTDERLNNFKRFMLWLKAWGITNGRILSVTYPGSQYGLPPERIKKVWKEMTYFIIENGFHYTPVIDIVNSLLGRSNVVCVFKPCDPFNTIAVDEIQPDGTVASCMRHELYQKDDEILNIREWILYHTPQEYGGCKGCKWFPYCYGGCSANGINGDWRNRDANCLIYKTIFETVENIMRYLGMEPVKKNWLDELRLPEYFKSYYSSSKSIDHLDGIEHIDGTIRHLDSNIYNVNYNKTIQGHLDGIEHTDGGIRHLDSNILPNHTDGIEHLDGGWRHLDG